MMVIIRIQAQKNPDMLWNEVIGNKDRLQNALGKNGRLLYLSKRSKYNEVSLFMHIADNNLLGDFIVRHLAKLPSTERILVINLLKPVFFPLTDSVREMKRYTVMLNVSSSCLMDVYEQLLGCQTPEGIKSGYLAYTFHVFGDSIHLAISAKDKNAVEKYINGTVKNIPGVLDVFIHEIEKTHPFVSYEEWQSYTERNSFLVDWDEEHMVAQFKS